MIQLETEKHLYEWLKLLEMYQSVKNMSMI